MKKATIHISYDEEKLNAMKLYLEQKKVHILIMRLSKCLILCLIKLFRQVSVISYQ